MAIENQAQRYYGLQYHPEVKHTDRGMETLKHFLFGIAKLTADWKLENILEEELEKLRQQVRKQLQCHVSSNTFMHWLCHSFAQNRILTCYGCLVENVCKPLDCLLHECGRISSCSNNDECTSKECACPSFVLLHKSSSARKDTCLPHGSTNMSRQFSDPPHALLFSILGPQDWPHVLCLP